MSSTRRKESSRSLSHLLMSFLLAKPAKLIGLVLGCVADQKLLYSVCTVRV